MFQLDEAVIDLVQNFYVSNVKNRLRELETPDTNLKKRWIWELIQNGKDCSKEAKSYISNPEKLPFTRSSQTVDIKIIYDKSKRLVIFKHNGFPFTARTLNSLMYKQSSKGDDEDKTGRFGTGFMTSHTLSRIVPIHAPFLAKKDDEWEILYIEAIVYRAGNSDKQLGEEFRKMEKSKKKIKFDPNNEEHKWTTFTYELTNDIAFESAELAIQSFRENIMEALLFCDEINSIQLNDEAPIFSSAISSSKNLTNLLINQRIFNNIQIIEKTVIYSKERKFIVASVEEPNEQFSKKYSIEHDKEYKLEKLKFKIAFEIDSNQKMVNFNQDKICLFCTFPLIGSEKYQLPFLLNSPQFETFAERDGIILEGDQFKSNKILSNSGLNSLILNSSIELFSIVLNMLIQNNFSNFASFSNGLIYNSNSLELMKPFLEKLRTIMKESKIIHNSDGNQVQLKQITILNFNGVKNPKSFHNLASQLYKNVASFDECNEWQNRTWDKISVLDVDTFVNHISHIGRNESFNPTNDFCYKLSNSLFTNNLNSLENQDYDFLNKLYMFLLIEENENQNRIEIKDSSIFNKYKIILNSENNFTFLKNLKSNSDCSNDFNKIMELCKNWKSKIVDSHINSFVNIIPKVSINDALQEINFVLESDENNLQFLLDFIRFTLNENENRKKMYQVAKLFYNIPSEIVLSDVDERIWSSVDLLLLKQINQIINKEKGKKFTKSMKDLNYFYELYQKYNSNTKFLVPNFNLIFTEKSKLGSISSEIDPVLLKTLGPFINLSQYAHPLITTVSFNNIYNLDRLIKTINSDDFFTQNGVVMDDRLFSVLSIMPPESNQRLFAFQTNVRELAQLFFCSEIKIIPTSIVNELFWKRANEIVLDAIEDNLAQNSNIQTLTDILMKDEETIFNNLNMYYEILSTEESNRQNKAMVPNYKGSFLPAKNICLSKGVSEELFDLYNVVQSDSDVREKYAHPSVVCNFLNVIDFKQFISSICEGLSDDQLVNDSNILHAISNLNINRNNNNNSGTNENEILLQKLYTANIKNRLNEIQNPRENDKMRWPWELIQNAKDSLISPSNVKKQKQVEIFIGVKTDEQTGQYTEISFSHTGPPFTDNSFIGLLYKISQEKENPETTGRFGTGFVSTHVLSKVVDIVGNRIDKDGKIYGFSATMYREGIKEPDIIKDFKAMQESQKRYSKPFPNTKFTYKINSEQSRECVKLGLDHFKAHVSLALINCPEIKFIVINENGFQTKYFAAQPLKKKIGSITYYVHEIYKDSSVYQRFIVLVDAQNKLNISIEIDEQETIVPIGNNIENIFVAFPLVGSISHLLPFYLNSPKFEPSTERNSLILDGKEQINGTTTNTGINRFLLMKSSELYSKLITILNENHCPNIYELSRGLLLTNKPYDSFDIEWYQSNFLKNMREILASNVKVTTELGQNILLKDAFFPIKEMDNEIMQHFIRLVSRYCKGIVSVNDAITWKNRVWDKLNIVEIEGLVCEAEVDYLFNNNNNDLSYLNELLGFIWNIDKNILYEHFLIPDMNNELHCLSKEIEKFDIREAKTVKGQIIDIMESIDIKWRTTHMNHEINSISLHEDKIIDAESRIKEKIKEDTSMCFELMKFILENDEFRQNMFYFVTILNFRDYSPIIVNDINPEIWNLADDFVLTEIINKISDFSADEVESYMEFFIKFLPFYQNYQKDKKKFESEKIIPNAKCNLCQLQNLKNKKDSFHDHLNPIMIKYFGKDLDEIIVHPEINQIIKAKDYESLADLLFSINKKIKEFGKEEQLEIAEAVIALVPNKENNQDNKQKQIFTLYHDLINPNIEEVLVDSISYFEIWWRDSNEIIIEHICSKIDESENLENFKKSFSLNEDDQCFEILNLLYQMSHLYVDKYKIIPNRKGIFKFKKELKEDPGIKDDLLDCILVLKPESIDKYEFADNRVKIRDLDPIDIFDFYKDLSEMFTEALKKPDVDDKIIDMLKKIINIDDPSFFDTLASKEMTEDQKARMKILQNAHVQFLFNRLRELDSPSLKDFKRWPFELIQNANDSLFSSNNNNDNNDDDENQRKVKIQFDFGDEKVTFSHNGLPFTNDSLFALLYQCSEGKGKDNKTTGKFGTGFLSTLILSRVINFSGDVQTKDGISGFNVTMYRDGIGKDGLIKGVNLMEESLHKQLERKNLTTFEYVLQKSPNSRKAYEEGLKSLKSNVGPVLIYNPTIESITIKTLKETFVYKANHEEGNIQTISITTTDAKQQKLKNTTKKFILFGSNHQYNETKNVDINCLLQIDENNEIPFKLNNDVLFISYPLFDSDQFRSPILINSPSFEPEKERNNIIIQSIPQKHNEEEEELEESNESLINKFIISNTVELFKQIMSFVLEIKCTKLYNLALGLRFSSKNPFLHENFYLKMRETLLSFPVFETPLGLRKSDEVLLPSIEKYDIFLDYNKDDEKLTEKKNHHYSDFYHLVSQLLIENKSVVNYKCCKEWINNSWVSFPSQITIEDFIKFISTHEKVSDLKVTEIDEESSNEEFFITRNSNTKTNDNDNDNDNDEKISSSNASVDPESNFIKNVIVFIEQLKNCDSILKENNILINGKGRFVSSKEIHCFDLPEFIIEMLDMINYDYKEKTLHKEIQHLYKNESILFEKFDLKEAIGIIKDGIKEDNAIHFMKYVINESEDRTSMFEYTKFFLDKSIESIEIPNQEDLSIMADIKEMLNQADKFVILKLIKKVQKFDIQQNIEFFIRFFGFLRNCLSAQQFEQLAIYPNQKYQLCYSHQLKSDQINDENIKDVLENVLKMDLKETLILNELRIMLQPLTIEGISKTVLSMPKFSQLLEIDKESRFSFYSIIFKYSEKNDNIQQIMSALNFFLNFEKVEIVDSENKWTNELTSKVIEIAANEISNFVSQYTSIYELKDNIENENKSNNDFIPLIFENLSYLYNFTNSGRIFPNQIKQLVEFSEISWLHDQQLEDDLMEKLLEFMIEFSQSEEIRSHILHEEITVYNKLKESIEIYDLKFLAENILHLISESTEKDSIEFNQLKIKFIKFVHSSNELKIIFSSLIKSEMDDKMDDFLAFLDNSEAEIEIGFRGEALVYELLLNSDKFSVVNWMARSDEPTKISVTLDNDNSYFIKNSGDHYDIFAEDFDGNEYYFEVKSSKSDDKDKKFQFKISREQFAMANEMSGPNTHFVLVLVKDVFGTPEFLFLTKQNEIFTV